MIYDNDTATYIICAKIEVRSKVGSCIQVRRTCISEKTTLYVYFYYWAGDRGNHFSDEMVHSKKRWFLLFFIMNYEKICFQIIFNQAKFTIIMSIVEFSSICWRPSIYSSAFISDFYSSLFVSSHFRTARRMTFIAVIVSFIMSYHYP